MRPERLIFLLLLAVGGCDGLFTVVSSDLAPSDLGVHDVAEPADLTVGISNETCSLAKFDTYLHDAENSGSKILDFRCVHGLVVALIGSDSKQALLSSPSDGSSYQVIAEFSPANPFQRSVFAVSEHFIFFIPADQVCLSSANYYLFDTRINSKISNKVPISTGIYGYIIYSVAAYSGTFTSNPIGDAGPGDMSVQGEGALISYCQCTASNSTPPPWQCAPLRTLQLPFSS